MSFIVSLDAVQDFSAVHASSAVDTYHILPLSTSVGASRIRDLLYR